MISADAHGSVSGSDFPHAPDLNAALLQRIARRDRAALGELYCGTSASLRSVAYPILADSAETEDVIQEVYIAVWNSADKFDPTRGKGFSWLASIARRRAIDCWRTRVRRKALPDSFAAQEVGSDPACSKSDATDRALDADDHHVVRCAVAALPVEMGRVIDAVYFKGLTHAEVAALTGEPLGTVKARVRRALLRLRTLLKRVGFEHFDRIGLAAGIDRVDARLICSEPDGESPNARPDAGPSDGFSFVKSPNSRATPGSNIVSQNEESA